MPRKTITATALFAAIATATPAMAAVIPFNPDGSATISSGTTVGDSFTVNFDGSESGSVIPGLTSSLTLTFAGISGDSYLFNYLLNNSSSAPTTSSAVMRRLASRSGSSHSRMAYLRSPKMITLPTPGTRWMSSLMKRSM